MPFGFLLFVIKQEISRAPLSSLSLGLCGIFSFSGMECGMSGDAFRQADQATG